MMARTHKSKAWKLIAGTIIFGALMVIGLAAFPQQSVDAAPKSKTVNCAGAGDVMQCDGKINEGDTVKIKESYGKKPACTYTIKVTTEEKATKNGAFFGYAKGPINKKPKPQGSLCAELTLNPGELKDFHYTLAPKKGGKK